MKHLKLNNINQCIDCKVVQNTLENLFISIIVILSLMHDKNNKE